jgi:hypothetical protein
MSRSNSMHMHHPMNIEMKLAVSVCDIILAIQRGAIPMIGSRQVLVYTPILPQQGQFQSVTRYIQASSSVLLPSCCCMQKYKYTHTLLSGSCTCVSIQSAVDCNARVPAACMSWQGTGQDRSTAKQSLNGSLLLVIETWKKEINGTVLE